MESYFDLDNSKRKLYFDFCREKFGTADYLKNEYGVLSDIKFDDFGCSYISGSTSIYSHEPIYKGASFDQVYPRFAKDLREKRFKKLLDS